MPSKDDQKRWKEESQQLRKDLSGKQKVFKKREVDIKFGGVKKKSGMSHSIDCNKAKKNHNDDDFLRKQLGL
tara:strand:- start:1146 stop:1361 length:216 start_codon:yes stop_codon:yes gene_type:complete